MNNRISILITGAAAVVVLILLATLVAWGLRASGSASDVAGLDRETGSPFAPRVYDEASAGYVIAELYQDVGMDVRSGAYDQDGALLDRYWSYAAAAQTCSLDLVLADQHGRDEIAPTATPRPTHTPLPTDPPWNPEEYEVVERTINANQGAGIAVALLPTPRAGWPASTPRPTYTPYPAATPVVTAATGWNHWKGRPVAIEADGLAVLDVPRDARVSAYLSVRTGPNSGSLSELARMPLPDAHWYEGSAYVRLTDASGRILLESDAVDANYRAAVLHLEISPLPDCAGMRLRWKRSAAVAVKALTEQPFSDWGGRAAPPPTPSPAGVALYAAVGEDATFVEADMLAGTSSSAAGRIVIPGPECSVQLQPGQSCDVANQEDGYIAFAIRADLAPSGLDDIRQEGSAFNARIAFTPAVADPDVVLNIRGTDFKLYVTTQAWRAQLLGGEWKLSP